MGQRLSGPPRTPVLALNTGSSSLKLALVEVGDEERVLVRHAVERTDGDWVGSAIAAALELLARDGLPPPVAAGHRIVHGGWRHHSPLPIDDALLEELRGLVPFAPLHLPAEIAGVEALAQRLPDAPQVACFDTAFHRRLPEVAQRFPLPDWVWERGLRRYGFHGLSYEYVLSVLGPRSGRVVIAHLGSGASMAAVRDGAPQETTMGFTPTAGLVMGSRSGDLDPGLLVHLLREEGLDADALDRLVTREAGLLGVSGRSDDMRALLDSRRDDPRAALAVALFCHRARQWIGALAATLGGLDTLIFTGGIGEHAASVRAEICDGLEHLGVFIDRDLNEAGAEVVSRPGASCAVRVIPTDEEVMVARHTAAALGM